jgi:undecaprenyl diphosphate synthase
VATKRSETRDQHKPDPSTLRHVLVVGGTLAEWDELGETRWIERRHDLAKIVAHAGASWLTLRPYQRGDHASGAITQRLIDEHEGCTVIVDPSPDGRERFLGAVEQLRHLHAGVVDEAALAQVLMAPAPIEPDLTVVLGPSTQLPPSLVWELSYCELVFIDTAWDHLSAAHVEHAINEFAHRHRRFGGIE